MVSRKRASEVHLGSISRSPAQSRIITAALALFAEQGVGGTSLQMIADSIGVTKAAVYHQFKSRDDIVRAVAETGLARLEAGLEKAEAQQSRELARTFLINDLIDIVVERRSMMAILQHDPVMARFVADHEPFRHLIEGLYGLLVDDDAETNAESRVRVAMLSAAIGGALAHPLVKDLDDEILRSELQHLTGRLFIRIEPS